MKLVKLKDAIETLEKLKGIYNDLKLLIEDQVRDDEIDEADANFEKLKSIKKAIAEMENLNVQI